MSAANGIIRIGRKGTKKFAFGDDGPVFEVDVVTAFQAWVCIDEGFRNEEDDIPNEQMPEYHASAVRFVIGLGGGDAVTTAEALDFLARLREQYNEVAVFFRPRSREERDSPDTLEAGLRFSVEES